MCFNGWMSGGFSAIGLAASIWIQRTTGNTSLAFGVFFFFLMEFLQAIQYMYLATGLDDPRCNDIINQVLTVLGFIHVCCQPAMTLQISQALTPGPSADKSPEHNRKLETYQSQYKIIKRLCWIGGFLIFLRFPLSFIPGWKTSVPQQQQTEWLRGDKLCTFKTQTMVHLGWSVPMADPTYNIMGVGLHSFLMFAPFAAMGFDKAVMWQQGLILYLTGPAMAAFITSNLLEQASVWCFFSIAQICAMLFYVRKGLKAASKDGESGKKLEQRVQDGEAVAAKNGNGNGHHAAANGNGKKNGNGTKTHSE